MTRRIRLAFMGAALAVATLVAPAMAQQTTLEVVGTGDGLDVLRALASAYNGQQKTAEIQIPPSIGSGGGIAAVGSGKSVLGRVARKLTDGEIASGLVYKPIAMLPSAIFINANASVKANDRRIAGCLMARPSLPS